jgi:hypothetical protein
MLCRKSDSRHRRRSRDWRGHQPHLGAAWCGGRRELPKRGERPASLRSGADAGSGSASGRYRQPMHCAVNAYKLLIIDEIVCLL